MAACMNNNAATASSKSSVGFLHIGTTIERQILSPNDQNEVKQDQLYYIDKPAHHLSQTKRGKVIFVIKKTLKWNFKVTAC